MLVRWQVTGDTCQVTDIMWHNFFIVSIIFIVIGFSLNLLVSVLLSAHIKIFSVSRMQNLLFVYCAFIFYYWLAEDIALRHICASSIDQLYLCSKGCYSIVTKLIVQYIAIAAMLFLLTERACQKDMCNNKDSYWPTPVYIVHNYCNENFILKRFLWP